MQNRTMTTSDFSFDEMQKNIAIWKNNSHNHLKKIKISPELMTYLIYYYNNNIIIENKFNKLLYTFYGIPVETDNELIGTDYKIILEGEE